MAGWQGGRVALPDSSGVMLRHNNPGPAKGLETDPSIIDEFEAKSLYLIIGVGRDENHSNDGICKSVR